MNVNIPNGVWPTMLTPFKENGQVDYSVLEKLIEWYIKKGVAGLFAVCQSSEMFHLSLRERVNIAKFVKDKAAGRVPVIASGHVSYSLDDQVREIEMMAQTGVDSVVLITNRQARQSESDEIWKSNMEKLLKMLPEDIPLGFYECPYPYKRVLSPQLLKWCADTGRFYFLKDTSCDIDNIQGKLELVKQTGVKIFNANTATLLKSLEAGVHGYSGVMANFHPEFYVWMCNNWDKHYQKAYQLQSILSMCALIEDHLYPVNAKYYLLLDNIFENYQCRSKDPNQLSSTFKIEVEQLRDLSKQLAINFNIK